MNRKRRQAMRLALCLDSVNIKPAVCGGSYHEYCESLACQYGALPSDIRKIARREGRRRWKEAADMEAAAGHLVPMIAPIKGNGKYKKKRLKYLQQMQEWPAETPPCPRCRIFADLPKRSWPSKEQAEVVCVSQNDPKLNVYKCPVQPGYWHLGHRKKAASR